MYMYLYSTVNIKNYTTNRGSLGVALPALFWPLEASRSVLFVVLVVCFKLTV